MTLPQPFAYPTSPHSRRHGPVGYQDHESFKEWLRDEFQFRCVYGLFRERWYPNGLMIFSIDHVLPRSLDRGGSSERDYGNLVYACNRCNTFRGAEPILNPERSALGEHLVFSPKDGAIEGRTDEGKRTIRILKLNDPSIRAYRQRVLTILDLTREHPANLAVQDLFLQTFAYPDDLPDLRKLRPPLGNLRSGSEQDCYQALRDRGHLERIY